MVEAELRQQMAAVVHELYQAGLITPSGGNVSVRLPRGQGYLITPSGLHKGKLAAEDMVRLDPCGQPTTGAKGRPSVETPMHLKVYGMRPQCGAVIHTHAPWATLFGVLDMKIEPVTLESVRFLNTPVVPFHMPGSPELAAAVQKVLGDSPAVLLQNHGLLTCGASLLEAADAALTLEEVCRMLIRCQLLGSTPVLIPERLVCVLRESLLG